MKEEEGKRNVGVKDDRVLDISIRTCDAYPVEEILVPSSTIPLASSSSVYPFISPLIISNP